MTFQKMLIDNVFPTYSYLLFEQKVIADFRKIISAGISDIILEITHYVDNVDDARRRRQRRQR